MDKDFNTQIIKSKQDWINNFWLLEDILHTVYVEPYLNKSEQLKFDADVLADNWRSVAQWLNTVWWRLPDSKSVQHLPAFYRFCDLCSETWVFEKEVDKQD